ncbi:hypothetical protein JRI60_28810 [Archangium violaceum]|uniref:hypothetical protein n=1 Tax=Archangium violaceum TaxID=83451 RepID=UPI00194E2533|nr:hypothetical protein [Archangium violaceum]QRN93199.1 hypothetical protein JRI60_28810 [Archangium violaceum]
MSSVSRRESHPLATDLTVPHSESEGSPSRVSGRQETPAGTAQKNQVETYRGPVEQPRAWMPGAGPSEDGRGLTAAYADVRTRLHTDWKDWAITDADVRGVHEHLEKLPAGDYARTLARMEKDGLLAKYAERMGPEARSAFLLQAERKGYISSEPGRKAPPAPFAPPDVPAIHRNDARLPSCVRELVHESNRMAKRTYHDAHEAYVKRYSEQVMRAKSLLEIRALGEPVALAKVSDGLVHPHPDAERFRESWSRVPGNDTRNVAYDAVSKRMADLSGRLRPGSFWFKAEVELKAEIAGVGFKAGAEMTLTQDGQMKWSPKGGAEITKGVVNVGAEFSESGEPKWSVGLEHAPKSLGKTDPMSVGISADSEGSVRMELPAGGGFGGYAEFNQKEGTFGGGVSFGRKLGEDGEVKLGLGFGMQGARTERARDVASTEHGTLFGALPEQEQRLRWEEIPQARRERMERDGWTPELWRENLRLHGGSKR